MFSLVNMCANIWTAGNKRLSSIWAHRKGKQPADPFYVMVYDRESAPSLPESTMIAIGILRGEDAIGVTLEALEEGQPTETFIKIPWDRIGFIWIAPIEKVDKILRVSELPTFFN